MAGKIVIGGVTTTPAIVEVTPKLRCSPATVANAIRDAIVDPLEDLNGVAEYKREIAVVMGSRALIDAVSDSERRQAL
jgi:hypothetical protein